MMDLRKRCHPSSLEMMRSARLRLPGARWCLVCPGVVLSMDPLLLYLRASVCFLSGGVLVEGVGLMGRLNSTWHGSVMELRLLDVLSESVRKIERGLLSGGSVNSLMISSKNSSFSVLYLDVEEDVEIALSCEIMSESELEFMDGLEECDEWSIVETVLNLLLFGL